MKTKNFKLTNACISVFCNNFNNIDDKKFFEYIKSLPYVYYFVFQRETSKEKNEHWQLYIEFKTQIRFSKLHKDFKNAHIEPRKGKQEEAIAYCKKEESRVNSPFVFGTPKKITKTKTIKGIAESFYPDAPTNKDDQIGDILFKIKEKYYKRFEDIENEYPVLFWQKRNLIKNIWNEHNPISGLNTQPCAVLWIFGATGSGKSTYTKKWLRNNQYTDSDIAWLTPQNMTYNDKVYFDLSYENRKVLVLNEVDMEFPKHNNLIAFIDRNTFLITKGSHIRNNFELIIVNSLWTPEVVFSCVDEPTASQVLRRIYDNPTWSHVLEIIPNLEQIANKPKFKYDIDFQDWYKPIIKEYSKPHVKISSTTFHKNNL